jgi:hypothetical protein
MKKAMLFFVALLFSVNVNAATLSISTSGSSNATQAVGLNNGAVVTASGTANVDERDTWTSFFDVYTDVDTYAVIEWSFNPESAVSSAHLGFATGGGLPLEFLVDGNESHIGLLTAGTVNSVAFLMVTSTALAYTVSVTAIPAAVPVPAALFLFAPALLGFMGLRRRAKNTVA